MKQKNLLMIILVVVALMFLGFVSFLLWFFLVHRKEVPTLAKPTDKKAAKITKPIKVDTQPVKESVEPTIEETKQPIEEPTIEETKQPIVVPTKKETKQPIVEPTKKEEEEDENSPKLPENENRAFGEFIYEQIPRLRTFGFEREFALEELSKPSAFPCEYWILEDFEEKLQGTVVKFVKEIQELLTIKDKLKMTDEEKDLLERKKKEINLLLDEMDAIFMTFIKPENTPLIQDIAIKKTSPFRLDRLDNASLVTRSQYGPISARIMLGDFLYEKEMTPEKISLFEKCAAEDILFVLGCKGNDFIYSQAGELYEDAIFAHKSVDKTPEELEEIKLYEAQKKYIREPLRAMLLVKFEQNLPGIIKISEKKTKKLTADPTMKADDQIIPEKNLEILRECAKELEAYVKKINSEADALYKDKNHSAYRHQIYMDRHIINNCDHIWLKAAKALAYENSPYIEQHEVDFAEKELLNTQ